MITNQQRRNFIEILKKEGPLYILDAEEEYRSDFIIIKGLIRFNGAIIGCASEKLRKTEALLDIVAKRPNDYLVKVNGKPSDFAIQFIDEKYLSKHPEVVLEFLKENMEYAGVLSDKVLFSKKKIYTYVLENLERNPMLWYRLKPEDQMNKKVIMKVIHEMPNMIGKLLTELQSDIEVLERAAQNHHEGFNTVCAMYSVMDKAVQKDPAVCKTLVKADPRVFPYLKYCDEEIAKVALAYNGEFIQRLPKKMITRDLVETALQQNGMALQYLKEEVYDDKELVMIAVKNCGWAIKCASPRLQDDADIIDASLTSSPELSKYGVKRKGNNKR